MTSSPEIDETRLSEGIWNDASEDLSERFCEVPFNKAEIEQERLFVCCPTWLPKPIRYTSAVDPITNAFNSAAAQEIRASILDGSFRFCRKELCPRIQGGLLPKRSEVGDPRSRSIIDNRTVDGLSPTLLSLCYDDSCNLSCPSCRTGMRFVGQGSVYEARKRIQDEVVRLAFGEPHRRSLSLLITGSGDPFGSKLFRELLFGIDGSLYPNVRIMLFTNAIALTAQTWEKIQRIHRNLSTILVSVDAGNADDYAITRRGGDWTTLLKNLDFLAARRREGAFSDFRLAFVAQRDNYRGIPDYVRLAMRLGVDGCSITPLLDWGTWSQEEFRERAVWQRSSPHFEDFLRVLSDPILADPVVNLNSVRGFRREALRRFPEGD